MKTNKVLILVLVIVGVLILGSLLSFVFMGQMFWARFVPILSHSSKQSVSSEQQSSESSEQSASQTEESSSFSSANEVTPTGSAVSWDSEVKPIIESVFGGASLIEFTTAKGQNAYLKYAIPRRASSSDLAKILSLFKQKGYSEVVSGSNSGTNTAIMSKGDTQAVVTFEDNSDYVEVTIAETPSY
ncbi:hypothetical protein J7K05_00755 [bacterium]|nr:hypothetical protein [bacterium]